jgi:hypothetical protein
MSQHDMDIANDVAAAVRVDITNGLKALASSNSGASAPATTFAYMFWADTTNGLLKMRNGANSAWLTLGDLAQNLGLLGGALAAAFTTLSASSTVTFANGDVRIGTASAIDVTVGTVNGGNFSGTSNHLSRAGNPVLYAQRTASDGTLVQLHRDTSLVGSISVTGSNASFNTTSDARVKDDHGPAKYDPDWITRVAECIRDASFKQSGERGNMFIAQKLYAVESRAVHKGDDNPELQYEKVGDAERLLSEIWGVDASKLVVNLILEVAALRDLLRGA